MHVLQRLTTEYSAAEDRIRLAGEATGGATLTLWLTRRLLDRLITHLVLWLEQQHADLPRREILLEFAQHAAVGQLAPQARVPASSAPARRVESVDITLETKQLRLNFKSGSEESAGVIFDPTQLRQWLAILHQAYCTAEWPTHVWPAWITDRRPNTGIPMSRVMH